MSERNARGGGVARRPIARRREQLLVLSVAIVCGLLGFPLHILWIAAIVLMAILWGFMASELGGSRRGGVMSNAVTAIANQAQDMKQDIFDGGSELGSQPLERSDLTEKSNDSPDLGIQNASHDEPQLSKKVLYDEARKAGIEGRSNMTKDQLREALDD